MADGCIRRVDFFPPSTSSDLPAAELRRVSLGLTFLESPDGILVLLKELGVTFYDLSVMAAAMGTVECFLTADVVEQARAKLSEWFGDDEIGSLT